MFGKEKIEKNKAYIIAPNHISNWDAPVVVAKLKRNDVYVLAKEELFVNGFVKWIANKTLVMPVRRGKQDVTVVRTSLKLLKDNHIILIFPEGTRNGIEKNGKLHNGAVLMSIMSGIPIIPVGIQAKKHYKIFSKVVINVGDPIDFSEYKAKKEDKEVINSLSNKLMEEMIRLTNE